MSNNLNNNLINIDYNEKLEISPDDIYNINEVQNMKDLLTCPICLNILITPVQCNICNKCFCEPCINNYINLNNKCPFNCPSPQYLGNKFVDNVLSILKFQCKNGCKQIVNYNDLEKHYEEDCKKIDFQTKYKELLKKYKRLKQNFDQLKSKLENDSLNPSSAPQLNHPFYGYAYNNNNNINNNNTNSNISNNDINNNNIRNNIINNNNINNNKKIYDAGLRGMGAS